MAARLKLTSRIQRSTSESSTAVAIATTHGPINIATKTIAINTLCIIACLHWIDRLPMTYRLSTAVSSPEGGA